MIKNLFAMVVTVVLLLAIDSSTVQPPCDAITDATKLENDSVVVPDTPPNNGRQVGKSDSIQKTNTNDQ